jgi:Indolepyruvate ferredoxin oxidoreductase, alpha and beta subunits
VVRQGPGRRPFRRRLQTRQFGWFGATRRRSRAAGDDHAAKSSTLAHQSEHIFKACGLPVLFPSNVQEYLDFGLHGWAMSRYSGLWVAMKCVTDVVESSASVDIDPHRTKIILPDDFACRKAA